MTHHACPPYPSATFKLSHLHLCMILPLLTLDLCWHFPASHACPSMSAPAPALAIMRPPSLSAGMPVHGPPAAIMPAIYLSAHYSPHTASLVRRPAATPFWWRAYNVQAILQLMSLSCLLSLPVSQPACFSQVAQCAAPCQPATLKSKNKSGTVCHLSILVPPNNPLLCFKVDH